MTSVPSGTRLPSAVDLRTDALTMPRRELRGRRPHVPARQRLRTTVRAGIALIGVLACFVGALALGYGMSEEVAEGAPDMVSELIAMSGILLAMVASGVALGVLLVYRLLRRRTPERQQRLTRFARENGLEYLPGPYLATHLEPLRDRGRLEVQDLLRTRPGSSPAIEFGDFELRSGSPGSEQTDIGGYCAIRLSTALPHLVLRSRRLRLHPLSAGELPRAAQRLGLEGDFDDHFTLYCPEGAETDALALLTPDVMARLIDSAGDWDVELVGEWVILSRFPPVVSLDPAVWRDAVGAVDALIEKVARWDRLRTAVARRPAPGLALPSAAGSTRLVRPRGAILRTSNRRNALVYGFALLLVAAVVVSRLLA